MLNSVTLFYFLKETNFEEYRYHKQMLTLRKMVGPEEIVKVCQPIILNEQIEQVTDIFVEYPFVICFTEIIVNSAVDNHGGFEVQIRSTDNLELLRSIPIADRISRCRDYSNGLLVASTTEADQLKHIK